MRCAPASSASAAAAASWPSARRPRSAASCACSGAGLLPRASRPGAAGGAPAGLLGSGASGKAAPGARPTLPADGCGPSAGRLNRTSSGARAGPPDTLLGCGDAPCSLRALHGAARPRGPCRAAVRAGARRRGPRPPPRPLRRQARGHRQRTGQGRAPRCSAGASAGSLCAGAGEPRRPGGRWSLRRLRATRAAPAGTRGRLDTAAGACVLGARGQRAGAAGRRCVRSSVPTGACQGACAAAGGQRPVACAARLCTRAVACAARIGGALGGLDRPQRSPALV